MRSSSRTTTPCSRCCCCATQAGGWVRVDLGLRGWEAFVGRVHLYLLVFRLAVGRGTALQGTGLPRRHPTGGCAGGSLRGASDRRGRARADRDDAKASPARGGAGHPLHRRPHHRPTRGALHAAHRPRSPGSRGGSAGGTLGALAAPKMGAALRGRCGSARAQNRDPAGTQGPSGPPPGRHTHEAHLSRPCARSALGLRRRVPNRHPREPIEGILHSNKGSGMSCPSQHRACRL